MCVRCTAVVLLAVGTLLVGPSCKLATGRDEYGKGTDVERMATIHKTNTKGLRPSNGRTRDCWALGGRLTF